MKNKNKLDWFMRTKKIWVGAVVGFIIGLFLMRTGLLFFTAGAINTFFDLFGLGIGWGGLILASFLIPLLFMSIGLLVGFFIDKYSVRTHTRNDKYTIILIMSLMGLLFGLFSRYLFISIRPFEIFLSHLSDLFRGFSFYIYVFGCGAIGCFIGVVIMFLRKIKKRKRKK